MKQQSGWQLAGNAPESYEQHNIVAFLETSKDLVALAGLRAGERVLDVACGTGVLARLAVNAIGAAGKVAGADLNEAMLAMARVKAERVGLSIEWRACDAAELSFPDQAFDAVLCQWGLEFFSDRPRALRQIARVLAPGGRLVVRVWRALERQPFYVVLLDALERHLGPGSGGPIRAAFALSDPPRAAFTGQGSRVFPGSLAHHHQPAAFSLARALRARLFGGHADCSPAVDDRQSWASGTDQRCRQCLAELCGR